MKIPKVSCAMAILAGVLCASGARAQSYGDHDQVLTIGAAEFQSQSGIDGYAGADGYLYQAASDDDYRAPLSLPEGALIEMVCLYANDTDASAFVDVQLYKVKLVPGGGNEATDVIVESFAFSNSNSGYGNYCTEPFSHTFRATDDIDLDGTPDRVAYYVHARVPLTTKNSLGLGGVRITWKRQVSSPPQTPTFGDVPGSDPGFPFIEALTASRITAGCGGGNYCPDANLTRRQMAVFLAKALGLHWTDSTP
jgi:hypothetical protein